MNADAHARRRRWRGLYVDLFRRFALVGAQDAATARHLADLGAVGVQVTGSIKAAAPPLAADQVALANARGAMTGRRSVLLASSHCDDERALFAALKELGDRPLVLIAPRDPQRGAEVAAAARAHGFGATRRSLGQGPTEDVWVVDTYGEMGLWYRLCATTVMGGTFGPVEGHNPWEPAALGSAILHGPRVANFAADFAQLHAADAAVLVQPGELAAALNVDHSDVATRAGFLSTAARGSLDVLADTLLTLAGSP